MLELIVKNSLYWCGACKCYLSGESDWEKHQKTNCITHGELAVDAAWERNRCGAK